MCNKWIEDDPPFSAMASAPIAVGCTTYHSSVQGVLATLLDEILEWIAAENMKLKVGKAFKGLESVIEAHDLMDGDLAGGKIGVVLDK